MKWLVKIILDYIFNRKVFYLDRPEKPPVELPSVAEDSSNPGPKPQIFFIYNFNCWLCGGQNSLGLPNCIYERQIKMECSWCGIENAVKLVPPPVKA